MDDRPTPLAVTAGAPWVRTVEVGPFRVSGAEFPPGFAIPSHYHALACVSLILEGRFVEKFPGRTCECPPGSVLVKPPEERHVDRWGEATARHLVVEADPAEEERLGECAELLTEVRHVRDPGAMGLALRVLRELEGEDPARDLAVEALVLQLLVRIARGPADPGAAGQAPPAWLLEVRDLLHDRFRERLTLTELAEVAGVHPSHLSRTFSEHFELGVSAYLRRLRLEAARRELAETEDPISRVAVRNGFSDQSHLTRLLKEATGLTPARYRRTCRA